jgi:hypothetical protein
MRAAIRAWLISLYPRPWRERYADEFSALLEECLHSPMDMLDIFLGALDAHLELSQETDWRLMNMKNKLRTTILLVFAAYIAFIVAGMSLYGFADDSPFIPMMKTNAALSISWRTIQAGAVIALLSVVTGGAPLAWTVIRRALKSSRRDLRLLLVPLCAFLALLLYFLSVGYIADHTRILEPPASPTAHALMWGLIGIFILGAIASTVAVWRVISHTEAEQETFQFLGKQANIRLYEFAFGPAVVATLSMLAMFIASIVWFWQSFSARPDLLNQNAGPMMTDSRGALAFTLLLMAAAVIAACVGVIRGRLARNTH